MCGHILVRLLVLMVCFQFFTSASCNKATTTTTPPDSGDLGEVNAWITTGDRVQLLQKQPSLPFVNQSNLYPSIDVNPSQTFQTIEGFGYTLTGGSAMLLNQLSATERSQILQELFGNSDNSIRVSYLRISIGASDLDSAVFSYNDLPPGQTDPTLQHFSIAKDRENLIPVLKEILAINPAIKIMGSPWSPPAWMKDNDATKGGSLEPQYYPVYADYFVKYIQAMQAEGITVHTITPQNEPLHPGNNPSLYMTAEQQADFIKNHLGPKFKAAGITTKIIVYDHNADRPDYPITILNDPAAKAFVEGSAFHLYGGDVSALSQVYNAHPDKGIYFTEQWTGAKGTFHGDLRWHVKNVIVGTMRNWSRVALEWNLANDPSFGPHTPGGCTECKGALTIGNGITRNVSYYIIGHASKFVPPGSVRIGSNIAGTVHNVAFKTPDNKIVVIAVNDSDVTATVNLRYKGKWAPVTLPAGAVGTYVWQ
ncbi:MAG TPA: glycoside hydrolase family 30 beta sandwich domain-containing protein [Flavisolibacter sp.]|nr:glycoside hydrolase family 30 beta sandwich domain-containing protein [Flavisolibacter sp.]